MPINEAELRKKTAQGATAVTTKPATEGPTARATLLATALRVKADGSSDLGASALSVGIIGVLIIVVPAPNANVNINSSDGVITSRMVSIPRTIDTISMYPLVTKRIFRRSKISDNAPDGNARRKIGSALAVVTRETHRGVGAREVINHEAPTSYMAAPI